jgi:Alpha/beta hydrolase
MVSWDNLRQWYAAAIGCVAEVLNQHCTQLVALNDDVETSAKLDNWTDHAASAAMGRGSTLVTMLEQRVAEALAVRRGAHEAQVAVERTETDELARVNSWIIGVTGVASSPPYPGPPLAPEVLAQRNKIRVGLATSGDGKAIVASGNPDTAANVATFVPGTGSDLSQIGGDIDRSGKMLQAATKVGSPSTSVVTWIGYDAPNGLLDAASPSYADDVVFVASPGVGVPNASGLHLEGVPQADVGQHVHSTVAEHDMIHVTNLEGPYKGNLALGPDPATAEFGGKVFDSAPGTEGPWYTDRLSGAAHSEYWEAHNPSLRNFGEIIAGKQ